MNSHRLIYAFLHHFYFPTNHRRNLYIIKGIRLKAKSVNINYQEVCSALRSKADTLYLLFATNTILPIIERHTCGINFVVKCIIMQCYLFCLHFALELIRGVIKTIRDNSRFFVECNRQWRGHHISTAVELADGGQLASFSDKIVDWIGLYKSISQSKLINIVFYQLIFPAINFVTAGHMQYINTLVALIRNFKMISNVPLRIVLLTR